MKIPFWMLSSTGEGVSKRVTSVLTIGIALLGYFGMSVTGLDADAAGKVTGELFSGIVGLVGTINLIIGQIRAIEFKRNQTGKYSPNFRQ